MLVRPLCAAPQSRGRTTRAPVSCPGVRDATQARVSRALLPPGLPPLQDGLCTCARPAQDRPPQH